MKLIQSGASPYVRTVRVAIIEMGLSDQIEGVEVNTNALNSDPTVLAANPMGRIPTLVREDGPALYDSRVIARYLDAKSGAGLYPESGLWEVLTLEATAQGIMDSAVGITYEMRLRPEEKMSHEWMDAQWVKVDQALTAIEKTWMSHLHGPLDMAQISLACALGYLDLRHSARGWRDRHSAVAAWGDDFAQRESMQATQP